MRTHTQKTCEVINRNVCLQHLTAILKLVFYMANSSAMWSQIQSRGDHTHPPSATRANAACAVQTHLCGLSVGRLLGNIKALYSSSCCISELAEHKHVCVFKAHSDMAAALTPEMKVLFRRHGRVSKPSEQPT